MVTQQTIEQSYLLGNKLKRSLVCVSYNSPLNTLSKIAFYKFMLCQDLCPDTISFSP